MDNTESENEIVEIIVEQPTIKIDRRTIKRSPWRYTANEDGSIKYNHKPIDPLYFQKYYDEKRKFYDSKRYICECCNKEIALGHKARHQQTKYCIKAQNTKTFNLLD